MTPLDSVAHIVFIMPGQVKVFEHLANLGPSQLETACPDVIFRLQGHFFISTRTGWMSLPFAGTVRST